MARTSVIEDLFHVAIRVPWWASVTLGVGLYAFFKLYLPTAVSETLSLPLRSVASFSLSGTTRIEVTGRSFGRA